MKDDHIQFSAFERVPRCVILTGTLVESIPDQHHPQLVVVKDPEPLASRWYSSMRLFTDSSGPDDLPIAQYATIGSPPTITDITCYPAAWPPDSDSLAAPRPSTGTMPALRLPECVAVVKPVG